MRELLDPTRRFRRGRGMRSGARTRVSNAWRIAALATAFAGVVVVQGTSSYAQDAEAHAGELPALQAEDRATEDSAVDVHVPSDDALWLARICVHEAGWSSPDDCRAIWRVFERGARRHRTTPIGFARMYSRTVFDGTRQDPRGWITRLNASGEEPAGYPRFAEHTVNGRRLRHRHPPWSNYRDAWLEVLALSERVVQGRARARCSPDDWGGAMDAERAARIGLVPVNCGETHNLFYVRPRRVRGPLAAPSP